MELSSRSPMTWSNWVWLLMLRWPLRSIFALFEKQHFPFQVFKYQSFVLRFFWSFILLVFGNMFLESHDFVTMPVKSYIKDTCSNLSISNYWRETKLFDLVTGTATKPRLSGNMLPNIKTCENGWSNFSETVWIVVLKLLELTRFLSPNISIDSYLL